MCDKQEEHKTTHATRRKNYEKGVKVPEGAKKSSKTRTVIVRLSLNSAVHITLK